MNSHHAQLARVHAEDEDLRLKEVLLDAMAHGARVSYPAGDHPGKFVHWRPAIVENVADRLRISTEPLCAPAAAMYRTENVADEAARLARLCPAGVINVMGHPNAATQAAFERCGAPVVSFNDPQLRPLAWQGGNVCGGGMAYSQAGPSYMLALREVVEAEPGSRAWWYPYADEKLRAFMLGLPGWYATERMERARGVIALALRPILRNTLKKQ